MSSVKTWVKPDLSTNVKLTHVHNITLWKYDQGNRRVDGLIRYEALSTTLCSRDYVLRMVCWLICYMSSIRRMYDTDQTSRMCRVCFELNFRELRRVIIAYTIVKGWIGPERVPLWSLRFTSDPFLKTAIPTCDVFPKCLIFDIGSQKHLCIPRYMLKKYWLVLKRTLQETISLHIGWKFEPSLVYL